MAVFTPHTDNEIKQMLSGIGLNSMADLFREIPSSFGPKSFDLPQGRTEYEVMAEFKRLAAKNRTGYANFLGGGYYDHFIPAAVDAIANRSEFYTAYTPYQPEASQGTLQAIFEYQTMMARLTGLGAANASLYDGGTALYEAMAMAVKFTNRGKVIVDKGVNPLYTRILKTYTINLEIEIAEADLKDIYTDREKIKSLIDDNTAAVIMQNPNFFGIIDDYSDLFEYAALKGALSILAFYPVSLGILKKPAEMKADIAVAEGQSLGLPLSFGGPYLGIMAADKKLVRKMPGRIVGETKDKNGKRCFVLTLQAREQHIRREKATSNICSNQALCALRAVVYLSLLGKDGFRNLALLNLEKSEYLKNRLSQVKGIEVKQGQTFNEFTIKLPAEAKEFAGKMLAKGISSGLPASIFYRGINNYLIVAATEKRTQDEMDAFVKAAKEIL